MDANTYYLKLMFILLNISQLQRLMKKKKNACRDLIFEEKRQLIQVRVMMKIMKLVEYKLYIDRQLHKLNKKYKKIEDKIEKLTFQITQ